MLFKQADPPAVIHLAESAGQNGNFYKVCDVKSAPRMIWTAANRQKLAKFWARGDTTPAIAKALGCQAGAVAVARARFGLAPRRKVSGRPKQPDEPAHRIARVAFTTSRLMEFCTEKELVAQTGHESYEWLRVVVKELVDNGIDECEEAGIAPVITITITTGKRGQPARIVVADNGRGIPAATVAGVIDYEIRISSREAYISPTRGRQGNALKTILPMSYVLGGKVRGETWIEARGRKHQLLFTVNQIKQEPIVRNVRSRSRVTTGTRVTLFWPDEIEIDASAISDLLTEFTWVNPHLTLRFVVNGKTLLGCDSTNPTWTKYRACDATSVHWYTLEQFERYAGALISQDQEQRRAGRRKYTVRDFIAQFRGMSGSAKQKEVLHAIGASHLSLRRLFGSETTVDHARMDKLLRLVRQNTRPVAPESLGVIGEDHLRKMCLAVGGEAAAFKYVCSPGHDDDGKPYVVEIATCPYKKWVGGKDETRGRYLVTGVNFSATLENPFSTFKGMEGMEEILSELRAGSWAPVIVCVHYACPHIEYLDRGKSRIGLE